MEGIISVTKVASIFRWVRWGGQKSMALQNPCQGIRVRIRKHQEQHCTTVPHTVLPPPYGLPGRRVREVDISISIPFPSGDWFPVALSLPPRAVSILNAKTCELFAN